MILSVGMPVCTKDDNMMNFILKNIFSIIQGR